MLSFFIWYVQISVVGALAFPLAYRLLPALRDRGLTLARPMGLLAWAFAFWLLASLGVLGNDIGGALLALALVALASLWAARGRWGELAAWLKSNTRVWLASELLFLLAFAAWAFVRAANPDILYTEKPMEMAFINAILRSPSFPPHDPWLSGYAISYYYFGYVMIALLTRLSGVVSSVAFNLSSALWFALTAIAAYGLVFNLLGAWRKTRDPESPFTPAWVGIPLLGPLFVLVLSNLEGLLDVLHARGLFWSQDASGAWTSRFWSWLDIQELTAAPPAPFQWTPHRPTGWLWWRASRVVTDTNLAMQPKEVIDEFPFFSYLLSDLHPHVLAMPFALLTIALALNLYLGGARGHLRLWRFSLPINLPSFALLALTLGGLGFLNTWDFPIYIALVAGAFAVRRAQDDGWRWSRLGEFVTLAVALLAAGVLLYLPFYAGFSSQAGGILPSMVYFTRGAHFWVMFGTLLVPLLAFLAWAWRRQGGRQALVTGLAIGGGLIALLWLLMLAMGAVAGRLPNLGSLFLQNLGATNLNELLAASILKRLAAPGAWLTVLAMLAMIIGLLARGHDMTREQENSQPGEEVTERERPVLPFVLLLALVGALLALAPDFVYLRDQFGGRMNTIFKFYFQTWQLWAIAGAAGTVMLLKSLPQRWGAAFSVIMALVLVAGLAYPAWALPNKTNEFKPASGLTLDGSAYLQRGSPDDYAAIQWLQSAPAGVVAEAVGGAYSEFGRISVYSGMPAVLGWENHENQWRGGFAEMGSRRVDIETLYHTGDWAEAQAIIQRYGIRYIYVGTLERSSYRVNETKFQRFLTPVYQAGAVTIYEAPQSTAAAAVSAPAQIGRP